MKSLAIVGSRSLEHNKEARNQARKLVKDKIIKAERLVSGGARGVDQWARMWANTYNRPIDEYKVTQTMYESYGKKAPLIRNEKIAAECTDLVAFWDGKSRGTLDAVRCARNKGKRWILYRWDESMFRLELETVEDINIRR